MKTRILAGLVGLAVLLPAIVFGGVLAVEILIPLVLVICAQEYAWMAFPDDKAAGFARMLLGSGGLYAGLIYLEPQWLAPVGRVVAMGTMLGTRLRVTPDIPRGTDTLGRALLGVVWIGGFFAALPLIRRAEGGLGWIFVVLVIAWAGDTGAYFAGRAFGRTKLYEKVSPKTTVEGFVGGLAAGVAGLFATRAIGAGLGFTGLDVVDCLVLGIALGSAAVAGDLTESLMKRSYGVKDSGWIMPGHGGLLDRVDSVLFVAPLLYVYLKVVKGIG